MRNLSPRLGQRRIELLGVGQLVRQHQPAETGEEREQVRLGEVRPIIESVGGRIEIQPSGSPDLTIVLLHLPEPHQPDEFLPELPFFPT